MYAVGNTVLSVHSVSNLGPKAIAKRAAKDTAKALVEKPNQADSGVVPASADERKEKQFQ